MKNQNELNKRLIDASRKGDVDEVNRLLEKGADINNYRGTALMVASYRGHIEVVKILEEHINKQNKSEEPKKYEWFVSYCFSKDKKNVFGDMMFESNTYLQNCKHIEEVRKMIKEDNSSESVTILNIIRLGENETNK